jgi:hypothetical protein
MFRDQPPATIALTLVVASLWGCETAPVSESPAAVTEINYEGLATVNSRAFELAQVRPGVDFGTYSRLIFDVPELAYRTPDRAEREVPLTEEQQNQFRDGLVAAFDDEFADFRALQLTTEPGVGTLRLHVRVQDIVASVAPQPVGRSGRAAALLEASGDAVIVIELSDSQSNEILARGVDSGSTGGAAIRTSDSELLTRFKSAEDLVSEWARKTRAGLESLLAERG